MKKELGAKIKSYRLLNKYTQEKFCSIIGLEQSNLSNIENGKTFPDTVTICTLIEKGKIEPNYLFSFLKYNNCKVDYLNSEMINLFLSLPNDTKQCIKHILESIVK